MFPLVQRPGRRHYVAKRRDHGRTITLDQDLGTVNGQLSMGLREPSAKSPLGLPNRLQKKAVAASCQSECVSVRRQESVDSFNRRRTRS